MKRSVRQFILFGAASLGIIIGLPASASLAKSAPMSARTARTAAVGRVARAGFASAQNQLGAEIIPAPDIDVGSALTGGNDGTSVGYSLSANGISNNWTTTSSGTVEFVIFVFSNNNGLYSDTVRFKVLSPSGGSVYQYTWKPQNIKYYSWYTTQAKGNFSTAGEYVTEVYVKNVLIGSMPLMFSA